MNSLEKLQQQYPIVLSQDVIWGDMDAFEHVNTRRKGRACWCTTIMLRGVVVKYQKRLSRRLTNWKTPTPDSKKPRKVSPGARMKLNGLC